MITLEKTITFRDANSFKDWRGQLQVYVYRDIVPMQPEGVEKTDELLWPKLVYPPHHVDLDSFTTELKSRIPVGVTLSNVECYLDPETLREVFRCMIYKDEVQTPYYTSDWCYVLTETTIRQILGVINYLGKDQRK